MKTILTNLSLALGVVLSLPLQIYLTNYGIQLAASIDVGGISYDRMLSSLDTRVWLEPWIVILIVSLLVSLVPSWTSSRHKPLEDLRAL